MAETTARLSQTDLGKRAGVAQSVISAYESDRREPGLRTLNKLIAATGHQLTIDVIAAPDRRLGLPDTPLGRRLRRRRRTIIDLAARHGARATCASSAASLAARTPSAATSTSWSTSTTASDSSRSAALERELAEVLGTTVDVVPADTLKRGISDEVLAEAIPL